MLYEVYGWQDLGESGDDLDPVLVSGFGRLSWVGADGGLTGSLILYLFHYLYYICIVIVGFMECCFMECWLFDVRI